MSKLALGSRRARDGEVPEVTDQRVSAGSLWAVVPKTTGSSAGRGPLPARLGGEPGSREAGGTLPEVRGDWQTRMRGGGALGEELTGLQNRQRADWTTRKELDQIWPLIGLSRRRRRGRRAREGGRGSGAGLPESRSGYERGGSASQLGPGATLQSAALQPGVSGREAQRREAGAGSRAEGSRRAALPPGPRRVLRAPGARGSAARALCGRIAGRRDGEPGAAESRA